MPRTPEQQAAWLVKYQAARAQKTAPNAKGQAGHADWLAKYRAAIAKRTPKAEAPVVAPAPVQ